MKNSSRNFLIFISFVIAGLIIWYLRSIVGYIIISWVLAMLGQPLMTFFKKIKFKKIGIGNNLAAGLTLCTFFVILSIIISLFVPMILEQARTLLDVDFATVSNSLEEPINQINQRLIDYGFLAPDKVSPIEKFQNDILAQTGDIVSQVFGSVLSLTSSLLIALFSIIFITFFFLREENLLQGFLSAFVPNEMEEKLFKAFDEIQYLLIRYFIGILGQITIITIIVTTGLTIVGIENALLIGLFAAFINVIPYLGPLIGATFGVFVAITSHLELDFYTQMLPMIGKVALVFGFMQLVDNFVLQPFIFSTSVKAHPLEIFIIILIGAEIYGIIGMVLAIPTYTVIRVVARTFLIQFKVVQRMTQKMDKSV